MFRPHAIAAYALGTAICLFALACTSTTSPSEPFRASRDIAGTYTAQLASPITDTWDPTKSWPITDTWWFEAVSSSDSVKMYRLGTIGSTPFRIDYKYGRQNDTLLVGTDGQIAFASSSTATKATGVLTIIIDTRKIVREFTLTRK